MNINGTEYITEVDHNREINPLKAKLQEAMELLQIVEESEARVYPNYWKRYYLLNGDHMILTEDGWESGQSKQAYVEIAKLAGSPVAEVILDEVNAP